jgi:hypothetical protein
MVVTMLSKREVERSPMIYPKIRNSSKLGFEEFQNEEHWRSHSMMSGANSEIGTFAKPSDRVLILECEA